MGATAAAWKDCPQCGGEGTVECVHCQRDENVGQHDPASGPCALCVKFHAAVKAAVDAEREACIKDIENAKSFPEGEDPWLYDGWTGEDQASDRVKIKRENAIKAIRARRTP